MLGGDLVGVAEAMIDAATDYLGGETIELDGGRARARNTARAGDPLIGVWIRLPGG